jgi:hypothetical protein
MVSVLQAVNSVTGNMRLRAAMLFGAWMESGQNATAVGDHGTSFGPWQIHTTVHPDISPAQAEDPAQAAAYMEPAYASAMASVPDSLWTSDPARAAEEVAYGAERPSVDYYASAGAAKVNTEWGNVQKQLAGQDVGSSQGFAPIGGSPVGGGSGTDTTGQDALFGIPGTPSTSSITTELEKLAVLVPVIGIGAVMIVLGLARATGTKMPPAAAALAL